MPDLAPLAISPEVLAAVRLAVAEAGTLSPPELLDVPAVLAMCSMGRTALYRSLSAGEFPPPVLTPSGKRWRRRDVLRWVEKLKST